VRIESYGSGNEQGLARVELRSQVGGQLDQAAVFLTGEWVGAEVDYDPALAGLIIRQEARSLAAPLD
jgi:hypothetical protein